MPATWRVHVFRGTFLSSLTESRGQRAHVYSRTKGDESRGAQCRTLCAVRFRVNSSLDAASSPPVSLFVLDYLFLLRSRSPPPSISSARSARVRDRKKMQLINDQKVGPARRFLPRPREKVRAVRPTRRAWPCISRLRFASPITIGWRAESSMKKGTRSLTWWSFFNALFSTGDKRRCVKYRLNWDKWNRLFV